MTAVPNIVFGQVYQRLLAQLPPWFGNQQFVNIPPAGTFTPTTNFNNVTWSFLMTAFTSYAQFQYDFLQLRIGQYEIENDPNWPIQIPENFPFTVNPFEFQLIQPVPIVITLLSGGHNYAVNDQLTLAGGIFNSPTVLIVTNVINGVINQFDTLKPGNYAIPPTNPVFQSSTTGNGKGASFNTVYAQTFPQYPIAFSNNLDLISQDFFGSVLPRRAGESDDNYRNRILANVMRLKCTRPAMISALTNLVTPAFIEAGIPVTPPEIYEGWYPADNGGYNVYQALAFGTNGGFNGVGAYGDGQFGNNGGAYTCTIVVFLPQGQGLEYFTGLSTDGESVTWGVGLGSPAITPSTPAIDIPPTWLGDFSELNYNVTEQDILNCINLTKLLGTVCNLIIIYVNN